MKEKFSEDYHKKFLSYVNSKNKESKIEKSFYKKTEKYIKFIKWIPGLKMIGVGNSISMNSATNKSDIDLFIITSPHSMWLNRIIITFIFQILGVRKTDKKHAGRFCLSFFATTTGLDFSSWKIENDIYLYFWIIYLKPVLNYDNTYEKFIETNSNWADLNKYKETINKNKKYINYKGKSWGDKNILIKIIDNLCKKIFLPKTLKHFEKIGKPFGVIINDDLLKFHNKDIRKKIKKELDL